MTILQLLAQSSYITYNKLIAKEYGVEVAILLGAMCSYQTSWGAEFYKPRNEITDDTALSDYAIRKATDELVKSGMLTVTLKGCPAQNYYTVNADVIANKLVEINELDMRNQRTSELKSTNDIINNTTMLPIKEKETQHNNLDKIKEIVAYLNEKANRSYRYHNTNTQKLITARLNEGFTVDDFKAVIDYKCKEWLNNKEMEQYLQPSTLFALSHFENYLQNAKSSNGKTTTSVSDYYADIFKPTIV